MFHNANILPELNMLNNFTHIHFIGIGGSGISALAYLALAHDIKVSGSDITKNLNTESLEANGAKIYIGHKAENLNNQTELVIYSEAIDKTNNPEFLSAKQKGLITINYFSALGSLSAQKKTIVITGTHGKTTTTAMLGQALMETEIDPTVIVGSRVPAFENKNIKIGHGKWLVVEGCEYRRNFLNLKPFGVIILNCELEHVDYYKNEEDYIKAFNELVAKIPINGFLIYNAEDENCRKIAKTFQGKKIPITENDTKDIKLRVSGKFNLMNAAHAKVAATEIGADTQKILHGLHEFIGTARRMEMKGEKNGIKVIDDYGHHPTEVKATLSALKHKYPNGKLICVFQPHQYSRTYQLIGDFKKSFHDADAVIIPNIFESRDTKEDKEKVSAEILVNEIPNANYGENFKKTLEILKKIAKTGDIIVTMGAGDVYKIGERFLANIQS